MCATLAQLIGSVVQSSRGTASTFKNEMIKLTVYAHSTWFEEDVFVLEQESAQLTEMFRVIAIEHLRNPRVPLGFVMTLVRFYCHVYK